MIDEAYKKYVIDKWKDAEKLATFELGVTSNETVISIFKMICQPYYYWSKK